MYPELMPEARELEATFGALLDQVDLVKNRTSVTELSGGLTNRNLAIESDGKKYVARISSNSSDLLDINREDEYKNSIIAAEAGIGAQVYDFLPGKGLLLIGFIISEASSFVNPWFIQYSLYLGLLSNILVLSLSHPIA